MATYKIAATTGYTLVKDAGCVGHDDGTVFTRTHTPAQCAAACSKSPTCISFEWRHTYNYCYLCKCRLMMHAPPRTARPLTHRGVLNTSPCRSLTPRSVDVRARERHRLLCVQGPSPVRRYHEEHVSNSRPCRLRTSSRHVLHRPRRHFADAIHGHARDVCAALHKRLEVCVVRVDWARQRLRAVLLE